MKLPPGTYRTPIGRRSLELQGLSSRHLDVLASWGLGGGSHEPRLEKCSIQRELHSLLALSEPKMNIWIARTTRKEHTLGAEALNGVW